MQFFLSGTKWLLTYRTVIATIYVEGGNVFKQLAN